MEPVQRCRRSWTRSWDALKPSLHNVLLGLLEGKRPWPLLLHGGAGRGKTCAGLLLTDIVAGSYYWTVEDLIGLGLSPGGLRTEEQAAVWYYAGKSPLCVIDELGLRGTAKDAEYLAVKRMADLREHKPSVWISNLSPRDLQEVYDDRILSRIGCGTVIELTGEDRRRARA